MKKKPLPRTIDMMITRGCVCISARVQWGSQVDAARTILNTMREVAMTHPEAMGSERPEVADTFQ